MRELAQRPAEDEVAQVQFGPGDPNRNARAIAFYKGKTVVPCLNPLCCEEFEPGIIFGRPYNLRMQLCTRKGAEGHPISSYYIAHCLTEKIPSPYETMFLDEVNGSLLSPKLDIEITFLGGLGRAGTNTCIMVRSGLEAILVDCGTNVANLNTEGSDEIDEEATTSDEDETLMLADNPDFQPVIDFCAGGGRILGVLLSHGHMDHIGGLPALDKAMSAYDLPGVYGHRFTMAVAHHLIAGQKKEDAASRGFEFQSIDSQIQLGEFLITPVPMMHSIPGAYGYGVGIVGKEEHGAIFFSGDFKARWNGPEDLFNLRKRLTELGRICAVFCDSTNAGFHGWTSLEQDVRQGLMDVLWNAKGRVFITMFASHVERIEAIIRICNQMGKVVSKLGTSMGTYLDAYDAMGKTMNLSFDPKTADVIVVAGCQGNEFSASRRLSEDKWVEDIHICVGDTVVISANPIPGRVSSVTAMAHAFRSLGANVIINNSFPGQMTNFERHPIHVSGHGSGNDIAFLIRTLFESNPELVFVPYHCSRESAVAAAELAEKTGLTAERILLYETNGSSFQL